MTFTQSEEYLLEDAIASLLSDISNINIYTSNRTGQKLFPYASISARPARQLIGPYSGVFEIDVTITYSNTSAKYTETEFDEQYLQIFSDLYNPDNTLAFKIQEKAVDLKIFMARISSQEPTIEVGKRAWKKNLSVTAIVVFDESVDGIYSYQFDDKKNSLYLATI